MASVIRFSRHGTKKRPFFRIVVQDHRSPRDGRFIENIGTFDPLKGTSSLKIERDRLQYWLSVGARPSLSIKNRLSAANAIAERATAPSTPEGKPKAVKAKRKSQKAETAEKSH